MPMMRPLIFSDNPGMHPIMHILKVWKNFERRWPNYREFVVTFEFDEGNLLTKRR